MLKLFSRGDGEPLCVNVAVVGEEEYGEKKDRGSAEAAEAAASSESESAGVMVGGAGCEV